MATCSLQHGKLARRRRVHPRRADDRENLAPRFGVARTQW